MSGEIAFKQDQTRLDAWADDCIRSFHNRKAFRLAMDNPTAVVYIIPSPLWQEPDSTDEASMLLVQENRGSYLWTNAREPLDKFELVSARFNLSVADVLVQLMTVVMKRLFKEI